MRFKTGNRIKDLPWTLRVSEPSEIASKMFCVEDPEVSSESQQGC